MKSFSLGALFLTALFCAEAPGAQLSVNADAVAGKLQADNKLPPLPEGVAELKFTELYKMPVGPRGLELTERVLGLAGKRVRIFGFMVRQQRPSPGVAIISPYALATNERDYDLADDLPPGVIFVEVPQFDDIAVPYSPRPLLLTGILEVGRRNEADGRTSEIRLRLDEAITDVTAGAPKAATPLSPEPTSATSSFRPSVSAGLVTTVPSSP